MNKTTTSKSLLDVLKSLLTQESDGSVEKEIKNQVSSTLSFKTVRKNQQLEKKLSSVESTASLNKRESIPCP